MKFSFPIIFALISIILTVVRAKVEQAALIIFLVTSIFFCLFLIPGLGPVIAFALVPLFLEFVRVGYLSFT